MPDEATRVSRATGDHWPTRGAYGVTPLDMPEEIVLTSEKHSGVTKSIFRTERCMRAIREDRLTQILDEAA